MYHDMKAYGKEMYSSAQKMEMSCQLHAPAALPTGEWAPQ
jgi:hypothetical protein